jgi:DNA-binding IclR family transcriptional regulator
MPLTASSEQAKFEATRDDRKGTMMEKARRNPVAKVLRAIGWLAEAPATQIGVRQLAAAMSIAPSTAHRILSALAEAGYVRQEGDSQRYSLTVEFFRLSELGVAKEPIRQAGGEELQRLVETCHESVLLCLYDEQRRQLIYTNAIEPLPAANSAIKLNKWLPVRTGASGLAILAFLQDNEAQSIISRLETPSVRSERAAEPGSLAAALAQVRRQGYACTPCQWVSGAVGLAAPIFNNHGRVMGDVCVTMRGQGCGDAALDGLIDATLHCARQVTQKMNGGRQLRG